MENHKTWLLIADSSQARLYSLKKSPVFIKATDHNNLALLNEFSHEESRKKDKELMTDRKGLYGNGTFTEATTPKLHEAEVFAIQLISHLNSCRKSNHFRDLILVAPPTFMGLLKKHMPGEMQKLLTHTIEKDYTHQSDRELMQHLIQFF